MSYASIPYPVRHADADSWSPGNDLEMPGSRPRFQNVTLKGGQFYAKGSVLGAITASGKYTLALAAAGDGSQTPIAVLSVDVDATQNTNADVTFDVMATGAVLNPAALVLGTGITQAAAISALNARGFTFRSPGFSGSPV